MRQKWFRLSAILLWLLTAGTLSQATEQYPPDIHWNSIDTASYRILYADGQEDEARSVAADLEFYRPLQEASLPVKQRYRRIPVVLSSESHVSNASIATGPFRGRFYNQPSVLMGLDWHQGLTIHEGKHTVQLLQTTDSKTGKLLYLWLGETGPVLMRQLFYPNWMMEGDAVLDETLLSQGGRGRIASFDLWFRTQLLTGRLYSYDRMFLGTRYEKFPDSDNISSYVLGYYMVTYIRNHYGNQVLDDVLNNTATLGGTITFDGNLKKYTGKNIRQTYRAMVEELKEKWRHQQQGMTLTRTEQQWAPHRNHWRSYYPFAAKDGVIWALRNDVKTGSHIVRIAHDQEKKIRPVSASVASSMRSTEKTRAISKGNDLICWIDHHSDLRFDTRSWGDLRCYSVSDGREKRMTRKRKLTSTTVKADDSMIAVAEYNGNNESALLLLDTHSRLTKKIPLGKRVLAYDLSWSPSGTLLFAMLNENGFSLNELDTHSGKITPLISPTHQETLRSPVWTPSGIVYSSDRSGTDQLWIISTEGEQKLIVQKPFGSYFPNWDDSRQQLVFADYGPDGNNVEASRLTEQQGIPAAELSTGKMNYFSPLLRNPVYRDTEQQHQAETAPVYSGKPYSPALHAFHPNSWSLLSDGDAVTASLNSRDILNTLSISATASYDTAYEKPGGGINLEYRRFYPVVDAGISNNFLHEEDADSGRIHTWRENTQYLGLYVPLTADSGLYTTEFRGGIRLKYTHTTGGAYSDPAEPDAMYTQPDGHYAMLQYYLKGASTREMSSRALSPRGGWVAEAGLNQSLPQWSDFDKKQVYGTLRVFLPGLMPTHSIAAEVNAEAQSGDKDFFLSSAFDPARGYTSTLRRENGGVARLTYYMPAGPVNLALGRFLYLKKWQLKYTADYEISEFRSNISERMTAGAGASLSMNLFSNPDIVITPAVAAYARQDSKPESRFSLSISN